MKRSKVLFGVSDRLHGQLVGVRPLDICRSLRVTKRITQLNIGQLGRTIVNAEKVPRDNDEQREGSTWRATLQLTSLIEMGQNALSSLDTQCGSSDGHARTSTSNTLRCSLSTVMTKASQFLPSSARTSGTAATWLGDHRHIRQPSNTNTELSVDASIPSTIDGDAPQKEDHPQADADANSDES